MVHVGHPLDAPALKQLLRKPYELVFFESSFMQLDRHLRKLDSPSL